MSGRSRHSERGASSVEYALLIAGIAAVAVLSMALFGNFVSGIFTDNCDTLTGEFTANGQAAQC